MLVNIKKKYTELIQNLLGITEGEKEKQSKKCRACLVNECLKKNKCFCRCHITSCKNCDENECISEDCPHDCHHIEPPELKLFGSNDISKINYKKDDQDKFWMETSNNYQSNDVANQEERSKMNSRYSTGGFPVTNNKDNYFLTKNLNKSEMDTIVEEEKEDKSNFITKNNLVIPPEKILDEDNSLYSQNSVFASQLKNYITQNAKKEGQNKQENYKDTIIQEKRKNEDDKKELEKLEENDLFNQLIEVEGDPIKFRDLIIANTYNKKKEDGEKSFDINNTQLVNEADDSNISANSIEKTRNSWKNNQFKKNKLLNTPQRSRRSKNTSKENNTDIFKTNARSIKISELEKEKYDSPSPEGKTIIINSRYSSNESNLILEDSKNRFENPFEGKSENEEIIHFNNESDSNIENFKNINQNLKMKIGENKNKTTNDINNNLNMDSKKIEKRTEMRSKRLEDSIKDGNFNKASSGAVLKRKLNNDQKRPKSATTKIE